MMQTATFIDQMREELEKTFKRSEAIAQYALKPRMPQVGLSPKRTVWTKNKARLYRYEATTEVRHATPILLVYALINRPYILDLAPGNSLVEFLVGQGYDVYMLDWGVPGEEDADMRLEDYVLDYIPRAAKQVLKHSGAESFTLVGYCMGGTLALLYAASQPEAPIKNLVLLTTPVDFSDAGLYSAWLDPEHFDVDRVVDVMKLVPSEMIDAGAKLLKPLQNYVGPYVHLMDRIHDEAFVEGWLSMNHWVNDGIPFAGETYRQWVKAFYQGNKLVKDELTLGGKPVKLANVRCSVLNVTGTLDHIVTPSQSAPIMERTGSQDLEHLALNAGHVGVVAGRSAKKNFFPRLDAWLAKRS